MIIYCKLRGSSLIETVIAITIITICSLVATLLYAKIVQQVPPIQKYELSAEINKLKEENNYQPFKKEYAGYSIEGRIQSGFSTNDRLKYFEFIVSSENGTLILPVISFKENNED